MGSGKMATRWCWRNGSDEYLPEESTGTGVSGSSGGLASCDTVLLETDPCGGDTNAEVKLQVVKRADEQ
jgi:hypothetical protein